MSAGERTWALELRKSRQHPWHTPPHLDFEIEKQYLISASCYDHAFVIGKHAERMTECESDILKICEGFCTRLYAWSILPNHYHLLVRTDRIKGLRKELGQFHWRSSFNWNGEDHSKGRKVWYNCFERPMKSERHFLATLNYVHHNAVHHGYVAHWQDWPWSSAAEFVNQVGHQKAKEIWLRYPILEYGKKWDP
jgi:REP-associated tyrosine transposase